jgi:hypothetical protein
MSADRRGFLRQLVTLPLVGGSLTLAGRPLAVAEPVSLSLLENYNQWLWGEHCRCAREIERMTGNRDVRFSNRDVRFTHMPNAGSAFHSLPDWTWNPSAAPASTRAALVLSAVGCDWRQAYGKDQLCRD